MDELAFPEIEPGSTCSTMNDHKASLASQVNQVEELRSAEVSQISL
jgi:hypothetical protein